jgi:N-acetylglutamate synthase-like GNAT family acetyltransferase
MNQDRLPLTLVTFFDEVPIGTAALKIREMETHLHFEHWLGSVYVQKSHRKRGFGTKLVQAIISEAARFGIEEMYLYTRGSEIFYSKLGWKEIEKTFFRGRRVTIMKYLLPKVS